VDAGFGGDVSQQTILDFVDTGNNVILAGSSDISDTILQLGTEFGVDFDDKGTALYDHFSYAVKEGKQDHTLIASDVVVNSSLLVGSPKVRPRPPPTQSPGPPLSF
jgi:oligosaccharyltransferase complex subunit beta